jgi:hypothetical protein
VPPEPETEGGDMTTNTRYRSRIGSYFRANIPPEERAKLDKQLEEFAVPQG